MLGDLAAGFLGALDEEAAVAQKVLLEEAEVAARAEGAGALERGDEVALEEVCAGGESDPVGHGLAEGRCGGLEEVERFGDGGCGRCGEGCDQGFNCGDWGC